MNDVVTCLAMPFDPGINANRAESLCLTYPDLRYGEPTAAVDDELMDVIAP